MAEKNHGVPFHPLTSTIINFKVYILYHTTNIFLLKLISKEIEVKRKNNNFIFYSN